MKIITINGHARAGKDSFVTYAAEFARVVSFSTITMIKEVATVLGWDGNKDEAGRQFLSDLKDAWSLYNDGPFQDIVAAVAATIKKKGTDDFFVFVHVREPAEIQKFKDYFGKDCITLLIKRQMGSVPKNHADQRVDDFPYDQTLLNNHTLQDLRNTARKFMQELTSNETMEIAEECGL